jgi:hypothetical protein
MRVAHRLMGKNLVAHSDGCGCDFVRSVRHAPWVTYNLVDGILTCIRCKDTIILPTPSIRVRPRDKNCKEVYMDHDAIADELNRFKDTHQDCEEPTMGDTITDPMGVAKPEVVH